MPLYEFDILNGAGEILVTVALPLAVAERDRVLLRRRAVPSRVGIAGAAADPSAPENQVLRTYRRLEERHGNNREFRRKIGHSPEVVKRVWGGG